jgi:hypothetical protein
MLTLIDDGPRKSFRESYEIDTYGFDTLYYPTTVERLEMVIFNEEELRLHGLLHESLMTTDFGNETKGMTYTFTYYAAFANRVAEYYRSNVKNKAGVIVLHLIAPQRPTRPVGQAWELKYSNEWRKLVSNSRKKNHLMHRQFSDSNVVIGPTSMDVGEQADWEALNHANLIRTLPDSEGIAEPTVVLQHVFEHSCTPADIERKGQRLSTY